MRLLSLIFLGLQLASACTSQQTSIRLDVSYEDAWSLDHIGFVAGNLSGLGTVASSLNIVVPDETAGTVLVIEVDGMRAGGKIASGEVRVTPELGEGSLDSERRIAVNFYENVNGIDEQSMPVRDLATGQPVPGAWTCYQRDAEPTPCLTGNAITVYFTPATPLPSGATYQVLVNPSGNLDVTDLAGNPAHKGGFQVTIP